MKPNIKDIWNPGPVQNPAYPNGGCRSNLIQEHGLRNTCSDGTGPCTGGTPKGVILLPEREYAEQSVGTSSLYQSEEGEGGIMLLPIKEGLDET